MANDTINLKLPVAINESATSLQVKAMVIYDGDMLIMIMKQKQKL